MEPPSVTGTILQDVITNFHTVKTVHTAQKYMETEKSNLKLELLSRQT